MFDQLCTVITKHYSVQRIVRHLTEAIPLVVDAELEGIYDDWKDAKAVMMEFKMPRPTIALDDERECFVVVDTKEDQVGLFEVRTVLQCQAVGLTDAEVSSDVQEKIHSLPSDALLVTVVNVCASTASTFDRVQYMGELGLSFILSEARGMICDPARMRFLEKMRLDQAALEDRANLLRVGHEQTVLAAAGAVERIVYASTKPYTTSKVRSWKGRKKNTQVKWEDRECLRV